MMKPTIASLLALLALLLNTGCESSGPVHDLGEATSKNVALLSTQLDQFDRASKNAENEIITETSQENEKIMQANSDLVKQMALMKIAGKGGQVDFYNNVTAIAQAYADSQNAASQGTLLEASLQARMISLTSSSASLTEVYKGLDTLANPSTAQQALDLVAFTQDVLQDSAALKASTNSAAGGAAKGK